jgi:predicted O-methyltransferase YrrM
MSTSTAWLSPELLDYIRSVSVEEHPVLADLREETAQLEDAIMQISPEQGNFMQLLVRLMGARRCIEVGVFTGYSSLSVALALPENGLIQTFDISEEWTSVARRYWEKAGVEEKVHLTLGRADKGLQSLVDKGEDETYDFAFIDADKTSYPVYFELCLTLLRKGGLILFDNTLWSQRVIDPDDHDADTVAIRNINQQIMADDRVWQSLLPLSDGVTLVTKK